MPAVEYFLSRINDPSDDRFIVSELFCGAQIFNPFYMVRISFNEGLEHIDKLKHYPILNQGEESMVVRLKRGWRSYRQNAIRVVAEFDYSKDKLAILSWHYQAFLHLGDKYAEDHTSRYCRYCEYKTGRCRYNGNLRVWWKAAKLMALVMPSSGAAERVFSLANHLVKDQQSSLLSDAIFLGLFLSYNKHRVGVTKH